ncbi:DUF6174 domain-containing protein [Streptomyces sp. NPDC005728]|uniref:DUF6174 domain-containing protein n=1 Tax=Streptomyces sp. NPDC005728 TaxID=3157054 RepID=UPI0034100174
MTAVRLKARLVCTVALFGSLLISITACGSTSGTDSNTSKKNEPKTTWNEPDSYDYKLTMSTSVLAGAFRVTVRDHKVTKAVGLDADSRRAGKQIPGEVPTIGGVLKLWEQARRDGADTAEAEYAADGHPVRVSLDWDKNAIDDEAVYVISSYEPAPS